MLINLYKLKTFYLFDIKQFFIINTVIFINKKIGIIIASQIKIKGQNIYNILYTLYIEFKLIIVVKYNKNKITIFKNFLKRYFKL